MRRTSRRTASPDPDAILQPLRQELHLRVEGRDDHHVPRPLPGSDEGVDLLADPRRLLLGRRRAAIVLDAEEAQPRADGRAGG